MRDRIDNIRDFAKQENSFTTSCYADNTIGNTEGLCTAFKRAIKSAKTLEDKKDVTKKMTDSLVAAASVFNTNGINLSKTVSSINSISKALYKYSKPEMLPQILKTSVESANFYTNMSHVKSPSGRRDIAEIQTKTLNAAIAKITEKRKLLFFI